MIVINRVVYTIIKQLAFPNKGSERENQSLEPPGILIKGTMAGNNVENNRK